MFTTAIVKLPGKNLANGLSQSNLGQVDFDLALMQHQQYILALETCGLEVIVLDADDNYPDSTFIEDVALCTDKFAVVCNPGAPSRNGEQNDLEDLLPDHFSSIEYINTPGTVEAGDIMMVSDHFYIGQSDRTNINGAKQMKYILQKYGKTASIVPLNKMLHLKTGLSYLENNNLLISGEFIENPEFKDFNKIIISEKEAYAANSLWINGNVLVPEGYPDTLQKIEDAGYKVLEIDVSEFRKLDGGLSCLSLRF
ncbi:MAG: hypothetical protein K9G76_01685 [Bacteroidales bacterium]|nr:hypothetical protein [Bacteroidales bacterium]MCF8403265.1 hypothetical protein [Bacteroidales bacterium]